MTTDFDDIYIYIYIMLHLLIYLIPNLKLNHKSGYDPQLAKGERIST